MLAGGLTMAIWTVQLVMPAFNANAFAVHKRIGHQPSGAVYDALQSAAGNLHLLSGLVLVKPFQITQAQSLHLFYG